MKKFFLISQLALLLGMLSSNANLEAAGCSNHKNKNVQIECSLSDDNCDNKKANKKFNKVEA
tara:strand:+ start:328 stop:513 length:186 start_codon:yes stop_codon:yes gene_type:complete